MGMGKLEAMARRKEAIANAGWQLKVYDAVRIVGTLIFISHY